MIVNEIFEIHFLTNTYVSKEIRTIFAGNVVCVQKILLINIFAIEE